MSSLDSIPVFFSDRMVADSQAFSPSARKPEMAVRSWREAGLPIEVLDFSPVTREQLCAVHDPTFVDGVLSCWINNGFGNRSPAVAAALPYTSGALLAAARAAIANRAVACAPVSGFHHAGYSTAEGFCTFNGLMVTAVALLESGESRRVGILDYDAHYGNGTDDIIDRIGVVDRISHYTFGAHPIGRDNAWSKVRAIPEIIDRMVSEGCDVIIYQAGADPHVKDPFGGYLTSHELRARDALAFRSCKGLGIPIVWDLAGGYQKVSGVDDFYRSIRPVLDIHDATMEECVAAFCGTSG
jgi:acetoin utilization deacetylase AcuC-like enzyme